jgi:hypothetical protein
MVPAGLPRLEPAFRKSKDNLDFGLAGWASRYRKSNALLHAFEETGLNTPGTQP